MNDSDLEYPHTLSYKKLNSLKLKVQSGFLTPYILRKLADEMDYQKKNRKLGKKDELFTVTKRTPDKNYGI